MPDGHQICLMQAGNQKFRQARDRQPFWKTGAQGSALRIQKEFERLTTRFGSDYLQTHRKLFINMERK